MANDSRRMRVRTKGAGLMDFNSMVVAGVSSGMALFLVVLAGVALYSRS